jgi:membrane protein
MAFDFVFAVFPGILVLSAFLDVLGISPEAFSQLIDDLGIVVPGPLLNIVEDNIKHLVDSSQSLLVLGLLGVIWPASASMSTTMTALNRAFSIEERRSFWQRRILSIFLVVAFGLSLVFLFNLIVFSEQIESWLSIHWVLWRDFPSLAGLLRRTAGIVGAVAAAACIYRLVPSRRLSWLDVLPGSLLFLFLWTFIAIGFSFYVKSFSYYNLMSGALLAVIIILLSAYLVAFTLLLGGELNATLLQLRTDDDEG